MGRWKVEPRIGAEKRTVLSEQLVITNIFSNMQIRQHLRGLAVAAHSRRQRLTLILAVAAACLRLPLTAADAFALDVRVQVDSRESCTLQQFSGLHTDDRLVVTAEAARSYCCSVRTTDIADFARFKESIIDVETGTPVASLFGHNATGTLAPQIPVGDNHPAPERTRLCFFLTETRRVALPLEFSVPNSSTTLLECQETTLVGNYNLVATDFAYLEVSNLLGHDVDTIFSRITYIARTGAGQFPVGGAALEPSSRNDHGIHEFIFPDTFGTLFVAHDGPPGSISAAISQYETLSVLPFTFRPVTKEVMRLRRQQ
ncbi:hypothetical protein [Tautonia sociabilis]|uniref:Uncharacterized protein n=1 Tax=Tautonia sociabilis TaxID=2080755 RepID=A0A432MIJ4_9BACT|nr:hypothetical protein [Tautonia sociabilis]RUL87018.1 hypothetical protein TsocGM_14585 [Tautonia sociabilis]